MGLSDNELLRYNRQIMLPQIDINGQQKLTQEYFGRLIEQQEMDDIGLLLTVLKPGTALASCDLQFHVPGQSGAE